MEPNGALARNVLVKSPSREDVAACTRLAQDLQEQQLPVKMPSEEPEEFEDALEVSHLRKIRLVLRVAVHTCFLMSRCLMMLNNQWMPRLANFGKLAKRDHRSSCML